ncbi:MAG: lamin tail domain-containing protein, partial [Candidatus Marinimicrobia bacterium]|nr:lamin tail domain-containing protein [Candidatus Neomarinimicrobiota bacterium]
MKSRIYLVALVLLLALSVNSFANVYATDVKVSSATLEADGTATVTISFILNEAADSGVDIKIYNSDTDLIRTISLTTAPKGVNTVEWDGKDNGGTIVTVGDYSIKITASDDGHTAWTKISDDAKTAIYSPRGVAVNRNPESPYFGRVYVTNKAAGTSTNTDAFFTDQGILMYTQDQEFIGFSNGGVTWPASTSGSPHKVMIGPDDMVYVGDYASDLLYAFDADIDDASQKLVIGASNKITGQYVTGHWVTGTGADRAIYTADGHYGAYTGIKKYDIGLNDVMPENDTGYEIINRPNGSYYQYDVEVASDGSVYMCQYRSAKSTIEDKDNIFESNEKGPGEAYPIVKYKPWVDDGNQTPYTIDDTLWTVTKQMTDAKGIGLDEPRNRIAYGAYNSGNVYIFNATTGELVETVASGRNRNWDVAFDAVGNMYLIDNSSEYWTMISPPDGANSYTTPCVEKVTVKTPPTVVINEIGEPYSMTNTYYDSFVELYNVTDAAIDVGGWVVWSVSASKATSSVEIPTGTQIAAGGYLIVSRDRTKFLEDYGTYVDASIVVDPTVTTGSVVYIKDNYYFELKDATGASIDKTTELVLWNSKVNEKTDPLADGMDVDSWYLTYQFSPVEGTPGHANSTAPPATDYTISEIQDTTGTGSADSPKVGEFVRATGIVTGAYSGTYTMQDGNGGFSGIWVNDDLTVAVGDEVTVKGFVSESYNLTVITADSSGVNSSGNLVPAAEVLTTGAVSAEEWEGVLIVTSGICDSENPDAKGDYGEWSIDDGSGTIRIDDLGFLYEPVLGTEYEVTGPLTYSFSNYKILPRDADDVVYIPKDLNLTFEDDSDLANWSHHDEANEWTTKEFNEISGVGGSGAYQFIDKGLGMLVKRPIKATVGTIFKLTIDIKSSLWNGTVNTPLNLSVQGISDVDSVVIDTSTNDFKTYILVGTAIAADGYVRIGGYIDNSNVYDTVWVDNMVWDDDAIIPDTDPPTIVMTEALNDTTVVIEFSEDIDPTTGAVLTNYVIDHAIGNPTEATVLLNIVTLKVSKLTSDTLYTMIVNNVEDLSENVIVTDSEITFMWQAYVPGPDLFFSEYIEGSSNNKALEIYNGKGIAVNLAEYSIKGTHNGDADWAYAVFNFPDIELAAGDVYIITNVDAGPEIAALADTALVYDVNKTASYNGDDARAIFWGEHMLDMIGFTDGDPGTNWPVAGGVGATSENTLVRKAEVTMGNVDWAVSAGADEATSEWVVLPTDVFRFLGSHPHTDFEGPELAGVVASGNALVQVRFSESVDSTIAVDVANYSIDGDIGAPTSVYMYNDDVAILAVSTLDVNTPYILTVNGIKDVIGNTIVANSTFGFELEEPGKLPIDITINDFETNIGNWAHPTYSGSTSGILTTSTFEVADTFAYMGAKSGEMILLDDPAVNGGWFVRLWNINRVDKLAADSRLFLYLRGADADIQIRLVIRDDGSGGDNGYEAGAWH